MPSAERSGGSLPPAQPLDPEDERLPEDLRSLLRHARSGWLPNTAVLSLLTCHRSSGLEVDREPPDRPPGGSVFLYDRAKVRSFRKDGHNWKKKRDGRTVRETHEKLKVDNTEKLNCYYAHPEQENCPQRRCYWQLESKPDIVLVHYLMVDRHRELVGSGTQASNSPGQSCGSVQGVSYRELQEDSEGNHSLGPFEQHSDFFEPRSDLDLNTNSMACGLDMMAQQEVNGVSEPMTEDSSFNLLQGFPQIGEMGRQQESQSFGALTGLTSVVMDSETVRIPNREGGLLGASLEGMWSGNYQAGPQQQGGAVPLETASLPSPGSLVPPIFDPSDFMDIPPDPEGALSAFDFPGLQEPLRPSTGQTTPPPLLDRVSAGQLSTRRHSAGSQGMESSGEMQGTNWFSHHPGLPSGSAAAPRQDAAHQPPPVQSAEAQLDFTFSLSPASRDHAAAEQSLAPRRTPTSPFEVMGGAGMASGLPFPPPSRPAGPKRKGQSAPFHQPTATHHILDARSARSASADLSLKSITTQAPGMGWADGDSNLEADYSHPAHRGRRRGQSRPLGLEPNLAELKNRGLTDLDPSFEQMLPDTVEGPRQEVSNTLLFPRDLSRNMSAPAPLSNDELFSEGMVLPELTRPDLPEITSSNCNRNMPPTQSGLMPRRGLPYKLLDDYAPSWDYTTGGSKMILVCEIDDENVTVPQDARLHVAFDQQEVLGKAISAGVVKVVVPPHPPGEVSVMLTLGNGLPLSNAVPFTYRPLLDSEPQQMKSLPLGVSDRDMQLHLIKMLTSGPSRSGLPSGSYSANGWAPGEGYKGLPSSYSLAPSPGMPREGVGLSPQGETLAQLPNAQLEKYLQRLLEKLVLQRTIKSSGKSRIEVRSLQDTGPKHLISCQYGGVSALHLLAGLGYDLALDSLLSAGADPSCKDATGLTAMHWATARGRLLTVALLAAREADADSLAAFSEQQSTETCSDLAARYGHLGLAAFLGELQLQQGVLKLADRHLPEPTEVQGQTLQRKRSRRFSPLLDASPDGLDSRRSAPPLKQRAHGQAFREESLRSQGTYNAVHGIVARARNNAGQLERAVARVKSRHEARQHHRACMSHKELSSPTGTGGNSLVGSDLSTDCHLNLNDYSSDLLVNTSSVGTREVPKEEFPNPFSDVSNSMSQADEEEDSLVCVDGGTPSGLVEDLAHTSTVMKALSHVEKLASGEAGAVHEYMYVRQAARIWLETQQGLGNVKHARLRGPSSAC